MDDVALLFVVLVKFLVQLYYYLSVSYQNRYRCVTVCLCVAGALSEGHMGRNVKAALSLCVANGLTGQLGMLMEIVCDVMSF